MGNKMTRPLVRDWALPSGPANRKKNKNHTGIEPPVKYEAFSSVAGSLVIQRRILSLSRLKWHKIETEYWCMVIDLLGVQHKLSTNADYSDIDDSDFV